MMPPERSTLEQENRRLTRAIEELSALNEIASAVSSTLTLDRIVETIVDQCVRHIGVEQGAVVLLSEEAGSPFQTMVRRVDSAEGTSPYRLGDQLTGWMLENRVPLLVNDAAADPRMQFSDKDGADIRSLLSVPMILKGRLIGLLNVFNKKDPGGFTKEDQRLLAIIASQSAQVIQHARLYENLEVAHLKLEEYSKSLEERVAERTRELREKNEAVEVANQQIQEATRNKSEFLRRMSHDLRSPMNAIIGYTRLLQRRLADRLDEREARNLANIGTSSGNLLNLINDILDLSRIEVGRIEIHPRQVDLRQLVDECADALESIVRPGVELRRQLEDVGELQTDPERLRQVVMNLLGNAAKFTEKGHIGLSVAERDGATVITVADTGIGIPPDDLPHIFDEFRQVERQGGEQSEGTGLGLAIAKKTVELLGGSISTESDVGVGTTFTVRIGNCDAPDT